MEEEEEEMDEEGMDEEGDRGKEGEMDRTGTETDTKREISMKKMIKRDRRMRQRHDIHS